MRMFEEWNQLQNVNCKVIINHALFDGQSYNCDMLQIINDEHRVGVVIKGRELFVYKQDIEFVKNYDNIFMISDGRLSISVIINNL